MPESVKKADVILIGSGIMSATLGSFLKELEADVKIRVFESLDGPGQESSNPWNNAGTGHAALCELNYTPESPEGKIDIEKAIKVNEQFQVSKQFWSHLVKRGIINHPNEFIRQVPHLSFVRGEVNAKYLKARVEALRSNPLFEGMEVSDDHEVLNEWIPLMMKGRDENEAIAATRIQSGTDVNFGALTEKLIHGLSEQSDVHMHYSYEVIDLEQRDNKEWQVKVKNKKANTIEYYTSKFVFIGAGGNSLPLLQKTGIKQSKNVGGFPVSGLFLLCNNDEVTRQHHAKVYGKAEVGAPPMSMPHLDTRYIDGKRYLLFGPFAGFSPKFLKTGSYFDLLRSVKTYNLGTMLASGVKEMPLTQYLIKQLMLSHEDRMNELRKFLPTAKSDEWDVITAGQRVQVIKDTEAHGKGTLQFGTEVITSNDGSIAALLGASPGASVSVAVMLDVLQQCFPESFKTWEPRIKEIIPSYGISLTNNPEKFSEINKDTSDILKLLPGKEGILLS